MPIRPGGLSSTTNPASTHHHEMAGAQVCTCERLSRLLNSASTVSHCSPVNVLTTAVTAICTVWAASAVGTTVRSRTAAAGTNRSSSAARSPSRGFS